MYIIYIYIFGGFHQWGYPKSWMVDFMEIPSQMDESWGYPYFRKPPFGQNDFWENVDTRVYPYTNPDTT